MTPDSPTTGSQAAVILSHLRAGRPITPLQALELAGSFRLAARIYELRCMGWNITMRKSKTGYAVYRLEN
jgi:hypothetical protein